MKIITSLEELHSEERCAVAVGKFDGVHAGHRLLLEKILAAKAKGLKAAVFTFEPSPEALFGMGDVRLLTTGEEKRRLLAEIGVDLLIEYPMNFQTAAVEPEEFIREFLIRRLHAGLIAAGEDLSFGNKGRGDFALLDALRTEGGYETIRVEKLRVDGENVSSSRIRELVSLGKMEAAEKMLGRPYELTGIVAHGRGLGHTIGFPTVNLYPPADKALPPYGVYRSELLLHGSGAEYRGITNIGVRPTVSDEDRVSAETYLYDFTDDLYDETVTVRLLSFQRPEQRFPNVDALKEQLQKDIREGRR